VARQPLIAIAKAPTANDFSNDKTALSTANLYYFTQPANTAITTTFPAGSLYGLNNFNPFNAEFQAQGTGIGKVPGGIITFGGGVPLYMGGQVIGGLGVSGDTACADHAIAYRMRHLAGLDGTPSADNIVYLGLGELPHDVAHPHCFLGHDITPYGQGGKRRLKELLGLTRDDFRSSCHRALAHLCASTFCRAAAGTSRFPFCSSLAEARRRRACARLS
jgi:uncharacterized protein GlcG (DUF336 family)